MNALAMLAVFVPLAAAAALIALLERIPRRIAEAVALGAALVSFVASIALLVHVARVGTIVMWFGNWHPGNVVGLGIAFAIDPVAAAVATLVCAIVTLALIFSREYFDEVGTIFYVLVLAMLGAMIAFAYAADAFDLFVFYEVFSVAAYALSAYRIETKGAFEGALQFALTNTVAGLFILIGISLLEGRTGELNLAAIGHSLAGQHDAGARVLAASSLAFVAVGLFTRGALVPLHFWFDEAHATAPTPLCIVLSAAMAPLALYGFVRFYWDAYAAALPPSPALRVLISGIGILSVVVGSLMCLRERQLKRAVAFSTVAHAGAALVAVAAFGAAPLRDAALYVTAYGCGAAALFAASAILRERAGSGDIRKLGGTGRRLRNTGIAFALGTLAVTIVPLGGDSLAHWSAVVVGITTGGAFAKFFWTIFVARTGVAVEPRRVPWFMLGPALAFGTAPLAFSVPAVREFAARAAAGVVDGTGYAAVLFGKAAPAPLPPPLEALGIGIVLAPLGALAVAWFSLTRQPMVARERRALRRGGALTALAKLHDGNASEYIGWIAGTAAVAATVCTWGR